MQIADLIGRSVRVLPDYGFEFEILGTISQFDAVALTMLINLDHPLLAENRLYSHAVATRRLAHEGIRDLAANGSLFCGVIMVPEDRFDSAKPFDTSWWRGGPAATTDVVLIPEC